MKPKLPKVERDVDTYGESVGRREFGLGHVVLLLTELSDKHLEMQSWMVGEWKCLSGETVAVGIELILRALELDEVSQG